MIAIWKRELKALFWNVTGWLFLGMTLALFGLYFFVYNLNYGYPYIAYSLSAISFIFLITVPILTMRILSEERKNKTDQLILTAPVSVGRIVVGKFLALAVVYTIAIAVISIAPLVLMQFGTVPLGESYVAIFGFWMYGLSCIAIGVFVSSLTESQAVSAVLTFVILFLGYMMSSMMQLISASGNFLTKICGCFDLMTPLQDFMNGIFTLTGMVYYTAVIAVSLFLTCQVIQKRRWSINRKNLSVSAFSAGMIVVVLAVAVILNFIVRELPSDITSFDATSQKLYTISEDTRNYLGSLKEDITVYVLSPESSCDDTLKKTLGHYEDASGHVKVSYVDTTRNPNFALQYTNESLTANSLIVVSEKRSKAIPYDSVYITDMDYTTYTSTVSGYDAEGLLTSAFQYVTSDDMPTVYELTGHGETALAGAFRDTLEKANLNIGSLNLLEADEVPADCELLFINGPSSDFSKDDAAKILTYLEHGGSLFVSVDGYRGKAEDMVHFSSVLSACDTTVVPGLVADSDASYYYQNPFYLLPYVEVTEATADISGNTSVFVPFAVGLVYAKDPEANGGSRILMTSDHAVSKVSYETATTYEKEEGDIEGPFVLGFYTKTDAGGDLAVFGSSEMFKDEADSMVSGRNARLFSGMVACMMGEADVAKLVIPVKDYSVSQIMVSANTILIYGVVWGIFLPLAMILAGVVIWAKRRRR